MWAEAEYPDVIPGRALVFPRDHGSHPAFRTEWWYITGWVQDAQGNDFGVQVTFFRSRPGVQEENPSAFAPQQIVFAHAALADARYGRLRHDQRTARAGLGLAGADEVNTRVWAEDWSLELGTASYAARIATREFHLDSRSSRLSLPLEGQGGFSRKGPKPAGRHYAARTSARGTITVEARLDGDFNAADHEWSSEYLVATPRAGIGSGSICPTAAH